MRLTDAFDAGAVALGERLRDRGEVLSRIAGLVTGDDGPFPGIGPDIVLDALRAREEIGSTGMGEGVAIPHCRLEGADRFVVGMLTTSRGVEFGALDGRPVRLFPFVMGPADRPKEHLMLLSRLARLMRVEESRSALLGATSASEVGLILSSGESEPEQPPEKRPGMRMLHVFVQDEDVFDDILQVFTATAETSAMVVEGHESTDYLHRHALFAGFWNPDIRHFNRLIIAVVREELVGAAIRSIEYVCGDIGERRDVLVTVTDLELALGSLDY